MSGFIAANQHHRFHFDVAVERYTAAQIQKDSRVRLDVPGLPTDDIKFGMKLQHPQQITVLLLEPGTANQVDLWSNFRNATVSAELTAAFPVAGTEYWEGFLLPQQFAQSFQFRTRLVVQPFSLRAPAFQTVPIVFTYGSTAGSFGSGHYIIGASVLVGQ